jgi:hypothetical protein
MDAWANVTLMNCCIEPLMKNEKMVSKFSPKKGRTTKKKPFRVLFIVNVHVQ